LSTIHSLFASHDSAGFLLRFCNNLEFIIIVSGSQVNTYIPLLYFNCEQIQSKYPSYGGYNQVDYGDHVKRFSPYYLELKINCD